MRVQREVTEFFFDPLQHVGDLAMHDLQRTSPPTQRLIELSLRRGHHPRQADRRDPHAPHRRPRGPDARGDGRPAGRAPRRRAAQAAAENALTGVLRQLFALSEAYPDLKASQNFQQLQAQLSDIENKIAAARRFFNNAVQEYNTGIQQFPDICRCLFRVLNDRDVFWPYFADDNETLISKGS